MNAAIDNAEAREDMGPDDWSYHLEEGAELDDPAPSEPETEGKPARSAAPREPHKTVTPIMTAKQYLAALKRLGLTAHYSAPAALGISLRMSARYAAGTHQIPATVALLVRALVSLKSR